MHVHIVQHTVITSLGLNFSLRLPYRVCVQTMLKKVCVQKYARLAITHAVFISYAQVNQAR
jgi:hypothetical protein